MAERQKAVEQMNASFALEDLYPDATDRALQRGYIAGVVTIEDLLRHAHEYATEARQAQANITLPPAA
jgi:hypothetical protein